MGDSDPIEVLSRLPADEFFDRQSEMDRLWHLATGREGEDRGMRRAANALVLGAPRVGKSEILRASFDRLFNRGGDAVPFYYSLRPDSLDAARFARDFLSQFLAQFIAFRRSDPRLISAAVEPLSDISRLAASEDYLWVRGVIDSFARASEAGDASFLVRCALQAPAIAASRSQLAPFVMVDNFHLLAEGELRELRSAFVRVLSGLEGIGPRYALGGLRRPMLDMMPPDEELFDALDLIFVEPLGDETVERMIRAISERLRIDISDSTIELMIQQLNRDPFYTRSLLDRAASEQASLKSFMEFERIYTQEVLGGRTGYYLNALLRDTAPGASERRAALEALHLVIEAGGAVPIDSVVERISEFAPDSEALLARMHARELLEINYGFINPPGDPVLADYVRARYRGEIAGARRPIIGEELLGEKLKHSYRLMMSRFNRSIELQLVSLLARFDFQSIPASLFSEAAFEERYRGMSRVQVRRALEDEQERVRLPQTVSVNDAGSAEQGGLSWRLFVANGFEGGIYSEANETLWLIALVNCKEPLDLETLNRIDQRLESGSRALHARAGEPRIARWFISKEGFSAAAAGRLAALGAHHSTYLQLDLLYDYLTKLAPGEAERRPASEFELVIPAEDDAELIAARTVEQIARAADFDQEAINQIKTALIEACINAAEHSDSPDRRIHQRFAIEDDRLVITVSSKGKSFDPALAGLKIESAAAPLRGSRGRGLQIIRALMDEVRFEPSNDGATLVMIKHLKRV
ncbi:MAG TPA: ATP-binding protein [Blastocatellia bacterium]|nr:ATP-binding protein [Blastocatellia bacterium]